MDIATLGVKIDPTGAEDGSKRTVKATNDIGDAAERNDKRVGLSMDSITAAFFRVNQAIEFAKNAYRLYEQTLGRIINTGVKFNATLESAQYTLAGTLQQFDSTGKVNSFATAMTRAAGSITLLKSEALKSQATFESLLEAVSISAPTALRAGMSIENLITTVRQLGSLYTSMGIMNVPSEIRQTITGRYSGRDFGAMSLGANREKIQQLISQRRGDDLSGYIQKLIAPRVEASEKSMESFNGRLSNFIDLYQQVAAEISKDVFSQLRDSYASLQTAFTNDKFKTALQDITSGVAALVRAGTGLTVWVIGHAEEIKRTAEAFGLLAVAIGAVYVAMNAGAIAGAVGAGLLVAAPWLALAAGIGLVAWNLDTIAPKAGLAIQALQAMFQQGTLGEFIGVTLELGFRNAVDSFNNMLMATFVAVSASLKPIWKGLEDAIKNIFTVDFWGGLGEILAGIALGFGVKLLEAFTRPVSYLQAAIDVASQSLKNAFGGDGNKTFDDFMGERLKINSELTKTAGDTSGKLIQDGIKKMSSFTETLKTDAKEIGDTFALAFSEAYGQFDVFGQQSERTIELTQRLNELIAQTKPLIDAVNSTPQPVVAQPGTGGKPKWTLSDEMENYKTDAKIIDEYKRNFDMLTEMRQHQDENGKDLLSQTEYFGRVKQLGIDAYGAIINKASATKEMMDAVFNTQSINAVSDRLGAISAQVTSISDNQFVDVETKMRTLNELYPRQLEQMRQLYELRKQSLNEPQIQSDPDAVLKIQDEMRSLQSDIEKTQQLLAASSPTGQFLSSLQQWVNNFGTVAEQIAGIITGTLNSAIDSMTNNLMKAIDGTQTWGQAFQQIGLDIINTLEQMIIKMLITYAIQQALNAAMGMGGVASTATDASTSLAGGLGFQYHDGGTVGQGNAIRYVSTSEVSKANRYHTGKVSPDEEVAVLKRGETVRTKQQEESLASRDGVNRGGATIINVIDKSLIMQVIAENPDAVLNHIGNNKSLVRQMLS